MKKDYEKYPINQKTYYSALKENGYCEGSAGKLDLDKLQLF